MTPANQENYAFSSLETVMTESERFLTCNASIVSVFDAKGLQSFTEKLESTVDPLIHGFRLGLEEVLNNIGSGTVFEYHQMEVRAILVNRAAYVLKQREREEKAKQKRRERIEKSWQKKYESRWREHAGATDAVATSNESPSKSKKRKKSIQLT